MGAWTARGPEYPVFADNCLGLAIREEMTACAPVPILYGAFAEEMLTDFIWWDWSHAKFALALGVDPGPEKFWQFDFGRRRWMDCELVFPFTVSIDFRYSGWDWVSMSPTLDRKYCRASKVPGEVWSSWMLNLSVNNQDRPRRLGGEFFLGTFMFSFVINNPGAARCLKVLYVGQNCTVVAPLSVWWSELNIYT